MQYKAYVVPELQEKNLQEFCITVHQSLTSDHCNVLPLFQAEFLLLLLTTESSQMHKHPTKFHWDLNLGFDHYKPFHHSPFVLFFQPFHGGFATVPRIMMLVKGPLPLHLKLSDRSAQKIWKLFDVKLNQSDCNLHITHNKVTPNQQFLQHASQTSSLEKLFLSMPNRSSVIITTKVYLLLCLDNIIVSSLRLYVQ